MKNKPNQTCNTCPFFPLFSLERSQADQWERWQNSLYRLQITSVQETENIVVAHTAQRLAYTSDVNKRVFTSVKAIKAQDIFSQDVTCTPRENSTIHGDSFQDVSCTPHAKTPTSRCQFNIRFLYSTRKLHYSRGQVLRCFLYATCQGLEKTHQFILTTRRAGLLTNYITI